MRFWRGLLRILGPHFRGLNFEAFTLQRSAYMLLLRPIALAVSYQPIKINEPLWIKLGRWKHRYRHEQFQILLAFSLHCKYYFIS